MAGSHMVTITTLIVIYKQVVSSLKKDISSMTKIELEKILKNNSAESNKSNKILAYTFIIIGLIFLSFIMNNGIKINSIENIDIIIGTIGILLIPFIPIIVGLLVLNKIPKQYIVTEIYSNLSIEEKQEKFNKSLSKYKIMKVQPRNDYTRISCMDRYFNGFDIFVAMDNEKYLFNVSTQDTGYYKGVFDLGVAKKKTKIIMASLQHAI